MDDIELLRRYVAHRSEADFAELVRRHINTVYRAVLRQTNGDTHRAEDVTQIVFTLLARKAASLTHHPTLTGWLYTTTRFTLSDTLRTERRRARRERESQIMHDLISDEAPESHWERMRPVIDTAMGDLSRTDREVILFRFFDELPLADIAAKLSLGEDTARRRISRAVERLQMSLAKRGVISTTTAMTAMLASEAGAAAPAGLAATVTGAALTSAASAGSQSLGLWQALSASKAMVAVVGTLVLAASGAAFFEWRETFAAKTALAAAGQACEVKQERLRGLEQSAYAAEQRRDGLQRVFDGLRATTSRPASASWAETSVDRDALLAVFPDAKRMLMEMFRSRIAQAYGAFYVSAGLTPVQIEQFERLRADSMLQSTTLSTMGIRTVFSQPPESEMRAILGDEAYAGYQDYVKSMGAREFVGLAAGMIGYAAAPLTTSQAANLAQLIANESLVDEDAHGPDPESVDWDAVSAQARGMMSAAQWKAADGVFLKMQFAKAFLDARKAQITGGAR